MKDASLPVTLIVVGLGWLLWEFRLFPDVDWIISLGFIAAGDRGAWRSTASTRTRSSSDRS